MDIASASPEAWDRNGKHRGFLLSRTLSSCTSFRLSLPPSLSNKSPNTEELQLIA